MSLLPEVLAKLNNRADVLKIKLWNNSLKYNLTDNINLEVSTVAAKVGLPQTCLDAEVNIIRNEKGDVIDYTIGNGTADCREEKWTYPLNHDSPVMIDVRYNTQTYKLFWKTSKKGTFETQYGITDSSILLSYPDVPDVEKRIKSLAPQGKYYTFDNTVTYKLSSSTDISLGYTMKYDRLPDSDDTSKYPVIDSNNLSFNLTTNF